MWYFGPELRPILTQVQVISIPPRSTQKCCQIIHLGLVFFVIILIFGGSWHIALSNCIRVEVWKKGGGRAREGTGDPARRGGGHYTAGGGGVKKNRPARLSCPVCRTGRENITTRGKTFLNLYLLKIYILNGKILKMWLNIRKAEFLFVVHRVFYG